MSQYTRNPDYEYTPEGLPRYRPQAPIVPQSVRIAVPNWRPYERLAYPGTDDLGRVWEVPPAAPFVAEHGHGGRPRVAAMIGATGGASSFVSGAVDPLFALTDVVHATVASGGMVAGLAAMAGISPYWRRIMNAGAPSDKLLVPGDVERSSWFKRKTVGTYDPRAMSEWFGRWMNWAGIHTIDDFRYREGEVRPDGATHRVSITTVMYKSTMTFPRMTRQQLDDPKTVRDLFWKCGGLPAMLKNFQHVNIPDDLHMMDYSLARQFREMPIGELGEMTCRQWPAVLPKVLQDEHGHIYFFADGGHIFNQPGRYNDGNLTKLTDGTILPNVNIRKTQGRGRDRGISFDPRKVPVGTVARISPADAGLPLEDVAFRSIPSHTLVKRDLAFVGGAEQMRKLLPQRLQAMFDGLQDTVDRAMAQGGHIPVGVPAFHGFKTLAAAPLAGTVELPTMRS